MRCQIIIGIREDVYLSDGGRVSLDWVDPKSDSNPTLTVVILHGLTGGSQESYIRHFIVEASKKNWRCVVFNMRGAADTQLHVIPLYSHN
jgi:predicted alpha/beta-fold hydrolase